MRDVARLAGVDASLVSRVVNDDPQLTILPATRARVLAAVERTGYHPNIQARGLRMSRAFMIGFLLPEVTSPVYGPIVRGAMRRAEELGYLIVLSGTTESRLTERSFEALLRERRVDGLLIASGELSDEGLRSIGSEAPIVCVNRRVPGLVGSVVVDDAAGAALAARHLIGLGHRRMAHLGGPAGIDTAARRREGFLEAVSRAGLPSPRIEVAGFDAAGGLQAARTVLESDPTVTGIVAANATVAIGAIRAAIAMGRRVPDDLSVVAIHEHPLAAFMQPPLTTVRMPLAELGAAAVEALVARLGGEPARDVMVEGELVLVDRESAAPPSASAS